MKLPNFSSKNSEIKGLCQILCPHRCRQSQLFKLPGLLRLSEPAQDIQSSHTITGDKTLAMLPELCHTQSWDVGKKPVSNFYGSVSILQVSGYGCSVRLVNNRFHFTLCQRLRRGHEGSLCLILKIRIMMFPHFRGVLGWRLREDCCSRQQVPLSLFIYI